MDFQFSHENAHIAKIMGSCKLIDISFPKHCNRTKFYVSSVSLSIDTGQK